MNSQVKAPFFLTSTFCIYMYAWFFGTILEFRLIATASKIILIVDRSKSQFQFHEYPASSQRNPIFKSERIWYFKKWFIHSFMRIDVGENGVFFFCMSMNSIKKKVNQQRICFISYQKQLELLSNLFSMSIGNRFVMKNLIHRVDVLSYYHR